MSDFKHSIVLFSGDDGLPLEFNVRNTVDKSHLKALIEHGGGFCTQNENAVHLISPGTKVLNVDTGKKLVSSSYIYDCVKENYLLDVNDYVFTIAEAHTSDISEENSEESLIQRHSTCKSPKKHTVEKMNFQLSPIKSVSKSSSETLSTTPSNLTFNSSVTAAPITNSSSTHSESFVEGTQEGNSNVRIISHIYSENQPDEIYKSPEVLKSPEVMNSPSKLISPFKNDNFKYVVSPKTRLDTKKAFLSSPRCLPRTDTTNEVSPVKAMEICDNVLSRKILSSQRYLPLTDTIKEVSPIKECDNVLSRNILTPSRYLPFTDTTKEVSPMEECENVLPQNILTPPRYLPSTDTTKEVSPIKAMEVCENVLSPKKSAGSFPSIKPTFGKSPVKIVEANQNVVKSPNIRETFALRPVRELFKKSPSPIQFEDHQPENSVHSYKLVEEYKQVATPTVVSSSQPDDELDKFDNMLLSKTQKKQPAEENEDSLSQSYTVSSSADAQVSSKPCSSDVIAPELNKENAEPDSPSLISSQVNVPLYIKNLEEKVKELLRKSPESLSIEDKATLVKYVCCARRAEPAIVLHSLLTGADLLLA